MRKLLPLAALLVALVVRRADEKIAAPVPKAPVPPSIDGKYTLLTSTNGPTAKGKGGFDPTDGGFGTMRSTTSRAETTISKTEIMIEPRTPTGAPVLMEYTLDPTKSPITIDVETTTIRGKKTKSVGIVEISGSRLTIALAREGAERPKTVDEGEGVTVYYFLKAPPAPRVEYRIVAMSIGKEEEAEKELNRLARDGYEIMSTTNPTAPDAKSSVTTIHFVLKRTVKHP